MKPVTVAQAKQAKKFSISNVPFIGLPDAAISSNSQDHVPVADIIDDLILYKDGGAAIILESSSLNFGLLSEREQEAVIAAYAGLINSLSFSIQILIRSQRKDITVYLRFLNEEMAKISNSKLKYLMTGYINFISDTIKKKVVLSKKFYIILPFSSLELGLAKSFLTVTKKKGPLPFTKSYIVQKAKIILNPRRDHLVRQMGRVGLKLKQLTTPEIIDLFWNIYNPAPPITQMTEK